MVLNSPDNAAHGAITMKHNGSSIATKRFNQTGVATLLAGLPLKLGITRTLRGGGIEIHGWKFAQDATLTRIDAPLTLCVDVTQGVFLVLSLMGLQLPPTLPVTRNAFLWPLGVESRALRLSEGLSGQLISSVSLTPVGLRRL